MKYERENCVHPAFISYAQYYRYFQNLTFRRRRRHRHHLCTSIACAAATATTTADLAAWTPAGCASDHFQYYASVQALRLPRSLCRPQQPRQQHPSPFSPAALSAPRGCAVAGGTTLDPAIVAGAFDPHSCCYEKNGVDPHLRPHPLSRTPCVSDSQPATFGVTI